MRVITRSWQSGPGLYLHPLSSQKQSLCVHLCCVSSDYRDFLSFGLPLGPHKDTHRRIHTTHRDTEMYTQPPTPFQALPNERDSSGAAGHPVLQMSTLQYIALHLSVLCKTNKLLVCECVCVCVWLDVECVALHILYFYQWLLTQRS